jgi:hypothetical protein
MENVESVTITAAVEVTLGSAMPHAGGWPNPHRTSRNVPEMRPQQHEVRGYTTIVAGGPYGAPQGSETVNIWIGSSMPWQKSFTNPLTQEKGGYALRKPVALMEACSARFIW